MSGFEREFANAVETVERDVFIDVIRSNPDLTLAEIAKLGRSRFGPLLSNVTVGEIIGKGGAKARANGRGRPRAKEVNTRSQEGRDAYDTSVLEILAKSESPMKAPDITSVAGGTPLQVRKALARLIEGGKVTWEGKARGMRYSAT